MEIDDNESEPSNEIPIFGNESSSIINITVDGAGNVIFDIPASAVETWRAPSLQIYPNPFTAVLRITGT